MPSAFELALLSPKRGFNLNALSYRNGWIPTKTGSYKYARSRLLGKPIVGTVMIDQLSIAAQEDWIKETRHGNFVINRAQIQELERLVRRGERTETLLLALDATTFIRELIQLDRPTSALMKLHAQNGWLRLWRCVEYARENQIGAAWDLVLKPLGQLCGCLVWTNYVAANSNTTRVIPAALTLHLISVACLGGGAEATGITSRLRHRMLNIAHSGDSGTEPEKPDLTIDSFLSSERDLSIRGRTSARMLFNPVTDFVRGAAASSRRAVGILAFFWFLTFWV